ncbi:unnamed protein product [Eruca vesicaria subsp. sativa]|uniref:Uncharacterized protein n=1 Tax=Eruca vesicaria subsp. sativa TaxID=29727 RepID=A0ABC8L3Z2_ERUVS|nr:unnamed protein product [Eruca vesicaria subsp. sativa]
MPKWFSDQALERDSKKYYVVPESELHDNDWWQLLMEVAFFSREALCLHANRPLELKKVVVETFEEYITGLLQVFCADPSSRTKNNRWGIHLVDDHVVIVRKTMDGNQGHMGLEVAFTKEQEKEYM